MTDAVTVQATDADGDTLSGPDASSSTIDENTGQIKMGDGTDRNAYEVVVIATDPSGASSTIAVTSRVGNVDLVPYDRDHNDVINKGEAIGIILLYFLGTG